MGPSREACDRCHAMKTRCVRTPRSQACVRCTRLGFSCHYSPPGRTGRPAGSKAKKGGAVMSRSKASSSPRCSQSSSASPFAGQVSPALTADDAAHSQLPIDFSDFEIFGSDGSLSEGPNSAFFLDDFFQDVLNGNTTSSSSTIAATPASTVSPDPLEQLFSDSAPSSRPQSVSSIAEAEFVLLDAQAQLLRLVRALSSCSSFPQDVEEIYRITDTFVKVVDDIAAGLDEAPRHGPCSSGAVTNMLLSSCYMSLVQAFECLVGLLRRELGPKADGLESSQGLPLAHTQIQMTSPSPSAHVPYISVGNVRLAMPHRAVAEINLHLVGQAVQHLKAAISRHATKIPLGLHLGNMQPPYALASSNMIRAFTDIAMDELEQREHSLFSGLQIPLPQ